jgi:hypothetical protein
MLGLQKGNKKRDANDGCSFEVVVIVIDEKMLGVHSPFVF